MGCGGSTTQSERSDHGHGQRSSGHEEGSTVVLHVVPMPATVSRRELTQSNRAVNHTRIVEEQGKASSRSSGSLRSSSSRSKGSSSVGSAGAILGLLPEEGNEDLVNHQVVAVAPSKNGQKAAKNPLQPPSSAGPTPISRDITEVDHVDTVPAAGDSSESPLPVLVNPGTDNPPRLDNSESSGATSASAGGMIQLVPVISNHATSPLPVWGEEYAALHTPILNPLPGEDEEVGDSQNGEDPTNTLLTSRILASPLFTDVMKNSIQQWIDTCIAASLGATLALPSYGSASTLDEESCNTEDSA